MNPHESDAMNTAERLSIELKTFDKVWQGGYFEGNPLEPLASSGYAEFGYISVLYAVYICCIKPYISGSMVALEIGPGRGAWTKTMLEAKEVWCLDAKSREDNDIDRYLGYPKNLVYHQVSDFSCRELPDDRFDYLFSFGALCHVSWDGIVQYMHNLYPKFRHGANAFIMIADYDKANQLRDDPWRYDVISRVISAKRMRLLRVLDRRIGQGLFGRRSLVLESIGEERQNRIARAFGIRLIGRTRLTFKDKNEDLQPRPGRWFQAGTDRTVSMLQEVGYEVVNRDIGLITRDPIIHFRKP
jgi:hypothetical protein